jgi:hypothetical protein
MAKKKRDLYISLLHFGREQLEHPVTMAEARAHLRATNVGEEFVLNDIWFGDLFDDAFYRVSSYNEARWALKMESYFQLLEYEELHEARQSSFRATMLAIVAIFISSAIGVISVVLALQNK